MTPAQYSKAIAALGMSQVTAGAFLGVSTRTSHGYANGSPIPVGFAKLLLLMVERGIRPEDVPDPFREEEEAA